jgi:hypothetical protein
LNAEKLIGVFHDTRPIRNCLNIMFHNYFATTLV